MRDADVRHAVRQKLCADHAGDADTLVVEEMGVWSGSVRIDVVVINGELHGYELKSARDTLKRLPNQAKLYGQVFDRVTLVAAEQHVSKAKKAVPRWWGIISALAQGTEITLEEVRPSRPNPKLKPIQLARLLWRAEALAVLERLGLDKSFRTASADILAKRLVEHLSPVALGAEVRAALKLREHWLRKQASNMGKMAIDAQADPSLPTS